MGSKKHKEKDREHRVSKESDDINNASREKETKDTSHHHRDHQHKSKKHHHRSNSREHKEKRHRHHKGVGEKKHKKSRNDDTKEPADAEEQRYTDYVDRNEMISQQAYERREVENINDRQNMEQTEENDEELEGGAEKLSLSISETNKLRAKLGLKPLDVGGSSRSGKHDDSQGGNNEGAKKRDDPMDQDIHAPPVNFGEMKRSEELKEKIHQLKEKRRIQESMNQIIPLAAESDEETDSAAAWVKKSRHLEASKRQAEEREKMLEEMDRDFGLDSLITEEFKLKGGLGKKKEVKDKKSSSYKSSDLTGLKIEHSTERFKEGRDIVLTLKDKNILEEDAEDILVNVNIVDDEKADKNVENKKKKPDYKPYDEPSFDEVTGILKIRDVLEKYDEEIEGLKKDFVVIGSGGMYNAEQERQEKFYRQSIISAGESLVLPPPVLASEFYTSTEMEAFKKPGKKKVRRLRKKVKLTADDLLATAPNDTVSEEKNHERLKSEPSENNFNIKNEDQSILIVEGADNNNYTSNPGLDLHLHSKEEDSKSSSINLRNILNGKSTTIRGMPLNNEDDDDVDDDLMGPDEDLTGVAIEEDNVQLELELSLKKARKLKETLSIVTNQFDPMAVKDEHDDMEEEEQKFNGTKGLEFRIDNKISNLGSMTLNSTSEFCRSLGEIPLYYGNNQQQAGKILDDDDDDDEDMEIVDGNENGEFLMGSTAGWQKVDTDADVVSTNQRNELKPVLDDEPVLNHGIAAALKLANKKGYLDVVKVAKAAVMSAQKKRELEVQNYSIEDKSKLDAEDQQQDKHSRRRERYTGSGPIGEFKEKEGYKPEIKLEYCDDQGREMSKKEAFRYLSHRFHGKGSGKKKTEKRMKKAEEESLMRSMSSTDTPLNTVHLLQEKQRLNRTPYVVLSGGKGMIAGAASLAKN